ncbi:uncharacterized protein JCM15063_001726 [Sporobolomyces koalae]|uniref:uncharacterized protein n=1 Tax=Sporobolomyces koalae TaxID=500713 RepID=UPI0031784F80
MPSSSTGIQRSSSPQPGTVNARSRSLPTHQSHELADPSIAAQAAKHRLPSTLGTPEVGGDHSNGYLSSGTAWPPMTAHAGGLGPSTSASSSAYRPRSPLPYPSRSPYSHSTPHEQGTLSTLVAQLYRSARSTFSSSASSSSSNANQPFANLSSTSKISASPRASTHSSQTGKGFVVPSASTVGFILLCCLWYLSSALSSNTGKSILTRFRYPVTLTFVQFAFVAGYSLVVLAVRNQLQQRHSSSHRSHSNGGAGALSKRRGSMGMNTLQGWGVRRPTKSMFHGTFMMSLFQIAGHVFSSMAIARVPVSTVHTIKALSPLFTVLSYVALFGVRYSTPTYISLFPLTIGVMLACSFDLRANAIGFLCALGSTFIFVAQNIFSKKLLPKESSGGPEEAKGLNGAGGSSGGGQHAKLDKMNLLFYSSGMAFFLMIPIWLYSDATSLFLTPTLEPSVAAASANPDNSTASLLFYFFLNGTVHFGQNLLAFSLLARTSPVTYSIASLVKRIAVICIAIVWFGQKVKPIQGLGMTMTFAGLYMYNQSKSDVAKGEKKRIMVEKKRGLELPTSLEDARAMDSGSGTDSPAEGIVEGPLSPTASVRPRISLEQPYNPYAATSPHHPAPPPPPTSSHHVYHQQQQQQTLSLPSSSQQPHVLSSTSSGASAHEMSGQVSRNRQTAAPLSTTASANDVQLKSQPQHAFNLPNSLPANHQLHTSSLNHTSNPSGTPIQVGYR